MSAGLPNSVRRYTGLLIYSLPGLILFFGTMKWGVAQNYASKRKDSAHFGGEAAHAAAGHH